jgi:D-aspartate ligase
MSTEKIDFLPVLLGSDANAYGLSRSFHSHYGIKPLVVGRTRFTPTYNSHIFDFEYVDNLGDPEVMVAALIKIAKRNPNKKLLLLSCGDDYVKLIVRNRERLKEYYELPFLDEALMDRLCLKENFYDVCREYNFAFPQTVQCTFEEHSNLELPFEYPIIIKPSNSVEYWKCSFPGKKKVFIANTQAERDAMFTAIYESSYKDTLIIQEYIPGDDSYMRVLNCYSGRDGKVKLMSLGHALLEEHTPQGIGSYAAIMSTYDPAILEKFKNFLEAVGYVGFSNFDMKFDYRDNTYKLFEINLRSGRSSFYVTAAGYNLAKYVTEDFIFNKPMDITYATNKHLWLMIPKQVLFKYLPNEQLKQEAKQLIKNGEYTHSLFYKPDFSFKRYLKLCLSYFNYFKKYKKYYGKKGLS